MSGDVDLDALAALAAAATPGPWKAAIAPSEGSTQTKAEYLAGSLDTAAERDLWVLWTPTDREGLAYVVPAVTGDGPTSEANAKFIAALVEAYPALIERVRRAEAATPSREALADLLASRTHMGWHTFGPAVQDRIRRDYLPVADEVAALFATTRTDDAGSTA